MPASVDRHLLAISRQLTVAELMGGAGAEAGSFTAADFDLQAEHFLDFYSPEGILRAFEAYGVDAALKERGLGDYELRITRDDAFHHRLEILLTDDARTRIMDLRIHLRSLHVHGEPVPVMLVEWLGMRNPRAEFTTKRPRLPGQKHPGTGLGRVVHHLLVLIALRLKRHALIQIPERPHLARLYHRAGYHFADEKVERDLRAVGKACQRLTFAAAAWAAERGFILKRTRSGDIPWVYTPSEMLLVVSQELRALLSEAAGYLRRFLDPTPLNFTVDIEGLRESLRADPVEGMDPDALLIDDHQSP